MKKFIYKKRGMALPSSIIIGILILSSTFAILSLIDNSIRVRKASEDKISSKYAAEAGIENAFYEYDLKISQIQGVNPINKNVVTDFNGSGQINDKLGNRLSNYEFSYEVYSGNMNSDKGIFKATGKVNNSRTTIKIEINTKDGSIINRIEE